MLIEKLAQRERRRNAWRHKMRKIVAGLFVIAGIVCVIGVVGHMDFEDEAVRYGDISPTQTTPITTELLKSLGGAALAVLGFILRG